MCAVHLQEKLGEPNKGEAEAVDARQELDLKVGVAFTRFQTRYFQVPPSLVVYTWTCRVPTPVTLLTLLACSCWRHYMSGSPLADTCIFHQEIGAAANFLTSLPCSHVTKTFTHRLRESENAICAL